MFSWKISLMTLFLTVGTKGNIYANTMMVTAILDEEVICVDFNGNEYRFADTSGDWYEGDFASCIMYDNHTAEVADDKILSAKYSGWCEGAWGLDYETGEPILEIN